MHWKKTQRVVGGAVAALLMSTAHQAYAAEFVLGEGITVKTNTLLQAGASIRTEERSGRFINLFNAREQGLNIGRTLGATDDDGNLNFDKGDIVSAPLLAVVDADFNFNDQYGFFIRGKAVTDLALELSNVNHGHTNNGYRRNARLDDSDFDKLAKFTNASLLDAFGYADFNVGDVPVTFRLGRQVVSWGESIFIQGGINTINPVDVSAFRRPGAQLKEGLLPVTMAYANVGLTENLNFEAFVQLEWQETVLDGCGTFFSTLDTVPQSCGPSNISGSALSDQDIFAVTGGLVSSQAVGFTGIAGKAADRRPDKFAAEQFGAALRYYSPDLDTEFGAYWTLLHSRTPFASAVSGGANPFFGAPGQDFPGIPPTLLVDYDKYINTFGASFATNLFGIAVAGEGSYRPSHPVQTNAADGLVTGLTLGALAPRGFLATPDAGVYTPGFEGTPQFKGQISAIQFFDQALGFDRITVIYEAGFERLLLDEADNGTNYGRAFVFSSPALTGEQQFGNDASGLITDFSWGYRIRAQALYNDLFAGINFEPSITWTHDVDGVSSDTQFSVNRKGVGLGAKFDYLSTYTLEFNYVNFFDGNFNAQDDRDFASVTARVQF